MKRVLILAVSAIFVFALGVSHSMESNVEFDKLFRSTISSQNLEMEIVVEHKVSKHEEYALTFFTYWYKITNNSKKKVYVQWATIDRLRIGGLDFTTVIPFKPEESKEFFLKSKSSPVKLSKRLQILEEWSTHSDLGFWTFSIVGDKNGILLQTNFRRIHGFVPRDQLLSRD